MLERSERILKIICLGLAALLVYELAIAVLRHNPLEHMSIPALPTLAAAPDAKATGPGTNSVTSKTHDQTATNMTSAKNSEKSGTNSVAVSASEKKETNSASEKVISKTETNAVSKLDEKKPGTNSEPVAAAAKTGTNLVTQLEEKGKGTNLTAMTNLAKAAHGDKGTNLTARPKPGMPAMGIHLARGMGKKAAELPPVIQARVDKIIDSEILGPVFRPVPMGLLGIAGEYAFLRAPSGQTEMVKEGAEMGGIKLIKIGINRVLVEEAGEKKELTIFDGYGGETLLPKPKDKPNETITKPE